MRDRGAYIKACVVVGAARILLRLPDAMIVRLIGIIGLLMRMVGAEADVVRSMVEVKRIFLSGPRATTIVRRLFDEGDPRRMRMIVRGSLLNGADEL